MTDLAGVLRGILAERVEVLKEVEKIPPEKREAPKRAEPKRTSK